MKLEDIVALAKAGYTADQIDGFIQYGQPQPQPQASSAAGSAASSAAGSAAAAAASSAAAAAAGSAASSAAGPQPQPVDMLTRGGSREIKSFDDVYNMMRELSNQIIASNVVASRQPEPEYNPSDELAKIINPYDEEEK